MYMKKIVKKNCKTVYKKPMLKCFKTSYYYNKLFINLLKIICKPLKNHIIIFQFIKFFSHYKDGTI